MSDQDNTVRALAIESSINAANYWICMVGVCWWVNGAEQAIAMAFPIALGCVVSVPFSILLKRKLRKNRLAGISDATR
jgi:hypothetical protein